MLLSSLQLGLLSLVIFISSTVTSPAGPADGIVTCRPDVKFLRDCGNECVCYSDGKGANCTSQPCPKNFLTSMRKEVNKVYATMDELRGEGNGPVFTCIPRSSRKINNYGGTCFCSTNGKAEICSEHPNSPWGS
ncbi:uncharacterized protein [Anabrus simplex]|uniref:uncharacterized protein n=1 Tax=Anabrus simplex TaxID=316456 RepID=UPI0035A2FCDE